MDDSFSTHSNHLDLSFNIRDCFAESKAGFQKDDFSKLEADLKSYVTKKEAHPRLYFLEFLGYHDPYRPNSQAIVADFNNVGNMIECGLFIEALDSIRSVLFPGLLPPATYLISLLEYAQQGNATSVFLRNFQQTMDNLLITNPPWLAPSTVRKYYTQVLQCPRCKMGLWPFLESAISYCLSRGVTCHPLPGPALPTLVHFYCDILALCLKLFQGELFTLTTRDFGLPQGIQVTSVPTSGSLMYGTFWTTWERSTLLSCAVKQLIHLLLQAAMVDYAERDDKQKLHLADILLHLLTVLVEFWCQQHFKLNMSLVERGLRDLSEHLALISQDLPPSVLVELVAKVGSTRLKLVMADTILRNLCYRNGFTLGNEPLSLKKMVLSYLPALGCFVQGLSGSHQRNGPASHRCTGEGSDCRTQSSLVNETSLEKENIPKRLNKVTTAGETLLHRACKRNQVETVLQILELPGIDVNVKGWTPLHEACNHGSTECVEALLHHYPAPIINNQVDGVIPLHDALLNGHMDITKILLEHADSVLVQQTEGDGCFPLDLVSTPSQREELFQSVRVGDLTLRNKVTEVLNLPLLEAVSCLLGHLILSYQLERGLPCQTQPGNKHHSLGFKLVRALGMHSLQTVTLGWTDQRAVRLVEDVETLLDLSRGKYQEQVCLTVRKYKGENTMFLMEVLENLRSRGEALLTGTKGGGSEKDLTS